MLTVDIKHRSFEETLLACEAIGGVDLIVTSPPYPDARPGQYGGDASHDFTWPDYQRLGDHVARALKPGGFAAVNIDGPVRTLRPEVGSERSLIAFKLAIDWAERVGLRYVEHCAYVRDGAPGLFGDRWRSGWEPVHVFQRPGAAGHFDVKGLQLPAIQAGMVHGHSRSRSADGFRGNLKGIITAATKGLTTAVQGFINCGTTDQSHPAPFGDWLSDAFVLCYSPPGGLVCDPFMGSGTVALSCARNGRNVIGGDLGARESDGRRWADIALERAMAIVDPAQGSLFG
jgi:hypothetical protein